MRKLILLLLIIMVSNISCSNKSHITKENTINENWVILDSKWQPNEEQVKIAMEEIKKFLRNIENNSDNGYFIVSAEKILNEFPQYRVQFQGNIKNGKKVIYCNFFHTEESGNEYYDSRWQENLIGVLDGGYWYWQIEYDIETGKCINFRVNGES